jgi:hypothetical protein
MRIVAGSEYRQEFFDALGAVAGPTNPSDWGDRLDDITD